MIDERNLQQHWQIITLFSTMSKKGEKVAMRYRQVIRIIWEEGSKRNFHSWNNCANIDFKKPLYWEGESK